MRRSRAALGTFIICAALGCGGNDPGGATLTIDNQSGGPVASVQFTGCDELEWGENQIDESETIAAGVQRSFDVDPGCYDIRAGSGTGVYQQERDVEIPAGEAHVFTVAAF